MTTKWIDGQDGFNLGDKAFLIEFENTDVGWSIFTLRLQPARTNQSQKPKLRGWCGSHNNVSTSGEGAWKIIRIARSGRMLLTELEDDELREFLEEMGYPELINHQ